MTDSKKEEKKEIENIQKFAPSDFHYHKVLGEGAFGIVRKCELDYEVANGEKSTSEGSGSEDEESLKNKFPDKDSRVMGVKLQSKYQLIKNK